jgi:NAD-dependent deacetylase sirtuin 4
VRRPDGDVELRDAGRSFLVPPCAGCGGVLKPDVVFFGDGVPRARAKAALAAASGADVLLVAGSSLMVFSAFRLARAAKEAGATLVAVNVGPTRADELLDVKLELLAGEALMALASHPALLLPRV